MKTVFIAGGGKHGSLALKYFMKQPNWRIIVSDEDSRAQACSLVNNKVNLEQLPDTFHAEDTTLVMGDAAIVLSELFSHSIIPEIVVPCVPFHFAAKVLMRYLTSKGLRVQPHSEPLKRAFEKARPAEVECRLNEENALVVASRMPFDLRCTAGCMQPDQCPVTKRKMPKPMYDLVTEALRNEEIDVVQVLISHLLAPGVGGFSGGDLKKAIELCIEKADCSVAMATSCSCHVVANVFKIGVSLDNRK